MKTETQAQSLVMPLKLAIRDTAFRDSFLIRLQHQLKSKRMKQLVKPGIPNRAVLLPNFMSKVTRKVEAIRNTNPSVLLMARGMSDGLIRQPILSAWICVGAFKGSGFDQV